MYLAVQIAIFVACIAIVCFVPVAILTLLRLHQATERLHCLVEQLRDECRPLVSTFRATGEKLHALSQMAEEQWHEIEKIIAAVRGWTQRADRLVDEIGSIIEPPVSAVSRRAILARIGLKTFFETLLSRNKEHERRQEKIYEPK